jgi:HEAT repeat protein
MRGSLLLFAVLAAGCSASADANPRSANPYERYLGAVALGVSRDAIDERRVIRQLSDLDPLARTGAIVALGDIGKRENVRAIAALLQFACRDHAEVISAGPGACGRCQKPLERATPNLAFVRTDAVRTLARLGGDEAQAAVLAALAKDEAIEVRRTAAHVASAFGAERPVLEALVAAMADPSAGVAYASHRSLAALSKREDLPRDAASWRTWLDSQPK